jgi:hypothetical protein
MTKPSSILFLSGASLFAFVLASGCGSDKCEDTDSCGDFPRAGASSGGTGGNAGHSGTSTGGSTAGSSAKGGASATGGNGGNAGLAGESGQAGGGQAGAGATNQAGEGGEGGEAGAGAAGAAGSDPCDGSCRGPTPVCDPATADCVECTKSSHCGGSTPVCDTDSGTCVQCTAADTTACDGDTPVCDTSASQCVACNAASDCTSAGAARCHDHACVACSTNEDCAHLTGTPLCDAGTCVQCTPADESACGDYSCNPATNSCTETPRGSVATCEPCLADSECVGGDQSDPEKRCIPMNFQGTARDGGFCLKRFSAGCDQPYKVPLTEVSLSGAPSEAYCGIDEAVTRCEAVLDLLHSRACPDGLDSSCGCHRDENGNCLDAGLGGLCRTVDMVSNQCTFPCDADNRCLPSLACSDSAPKYCE